MTTAMVRADLSGTAGAGATTASPAGAARYQMYGLDVLSDVSLMSAPTLEPAATPPDLTIQYASAGATPPAPEGALVDNTGCTHHGLVSRAYRSAQRGWMWIHGAGTFTIDAPRRTVTIYPDADAEEVRVQMAVVGHVAIFTLHVLGYPSLHASAVVTPFGAAGFIGHPGDGKSTMAAGLLRRGAALLTDDTLRVSLADDGVYGLPSVPMMKLWRQSAEAAVGMDEDLPHYLPHYDKRLLRLDGRHAFASALTPIRALYRLERYAPTVAGSTAVSIRTLPPAERIATLLKHTSGYAYLHTEDGRRLMPIYARIATHVPLRVLRYPSGFEHQEAVQQAIFDDLGAGQ